MRSAVAFAGSVVAAAVICGGTGALAHKTVVSPYTFHRDVLPIIQQRCAQCHFGGGIAQTLLTYEAARAQSFRIVQAVASGRMPPSYADSGLAAIKEQHMITARELDVLLTWAAGGAPEGERVAGRPSAVSRPD